MKEINRIKSVMGGKIERLREIVFELRKKIERKKRMLTLTSGCHLRNLLKRYVEKGGLVLT